jgi:TPR repeat protein
MICFWQKEAVLKINILRAYASVLIILTFMAFITGLGIGGDFEDAINALDHLDYATAYRLIKPLAEKGDARAQCKLGIMYDYAQGVPQDMIEATKWFRKAAEQGNAEAQRYLGDKYVGGIGVPQDYVEAAKWNKKAAEQGIAEAQVYIGMANWGGLGVTQNFVESAKWYRKAAEQGNSSGQWSLGRLYAAGEGVQRNYTLAHMWFNLALSRQSSHWAEVRKLVLEDLDRVAAKMTPAQIADAQRMARKWKPKMER